MADSPFDDVADFASCIQDTASAGIRLTLASFWTAVTARFGVRGRVGRSSVVV